MRAADAAGHDLLLRLAGRLADEPLWRLRDWLGLEARTVVAGMLPRVLLRGRVACSEDERALLAAAVDGWGGSRRLLDAVLPGRPDAAPPAFEAASGAPDAAALTMLAVVRAHPGCCELALVRRLDDTRGGCLVVLVRGGDRPWILTGTLQRVLRAHGERVPRVEVLPDDDATDPDHRTPYHRAAVAAASPLWRTDREPVGA